MGKFREEGPNQSSFDVKKIEKLCDSFIKLDGKRMKTMAEKEGEENNQALSLVRKKPITSLEGEKIQRESVEKCIQKSEQTSKSVIDTMSQFYRSKHSKKSEYEAMVGNLKYDRPTTSKIRRKNYKVIGRGSVQTIKRSRVYSEHERVSVRRKQHQFYMGLLTGLEEYKLD